MASLPRSAVASAVRRLVAAAIVVVAGPVAHLCWGFDYRGPGMHQVSLLAIVTFVSFVCAGIFLVGSATTAWAFRSKSRSTHLAADVFWFLLCCSAAVYAGLDARIEG